MPDLDNIQVTKAQIVEVKPGDTLVFNVDENIVDNWKDLMESLLRTFPDCRIVLLPEHLKLTGVVSKETGCLT
jgi:hypothetical protein